MKKIFFTVTNDLSYDQRMIRICNSLAGNGYAVVLIGQTMKSSVPLIKQAFVQKRLTCYFEKGKLFYVEYNLRLFVFLLTRRMDCICAIDLDTIMPCYFISAFKKIPRVYDAHELFCEMKEVVSRPAIHRVWKAIEKFAVPKFRSGYTVNTLIAEEFRKMYGVEYQVIRSITVLQDTPVPEKKEKYILYQGGVNEGRCFETLIPAMRQVDCKLIICGDGNFMSQARQLVKRYNVEDNVHFMGKVPPDRLKAYTLNAWIGITIFEKAGMSNYLSLANRFFDFMHAGVPQLCVDYPAYREINNMHQIAVLIKDLDYENIAFHCNNLLRDEALHKRLQQNCLDARQQYNWQAEEIKLMKFYHTTLAHRG